MSAPTPPASCSPRRRYLKDELTLLVDVGTNAEIVFGNRERLLACSSPTGPAFEGAQISCGQRAAPGAIERVRIDRETLEPRFKVIGCDLWSDEPGFAEATDELGVTGVCGSGIIEAIAEMFLAGIVSEDGVIDGALASRTPRIEQVGRTFAYVLNEGAPRLLIYQTDVRAIQLAKAALYAGAKLLMERARRRARAHHPRRRLRQPHRSVYAMTLGLIPDCDLAKVASAGNAAGTGARIALLNLAARAEIEGVVQGIEKIETAIEPDLPGPFRRRDGVSQQGGRLPESGQAHRLAGAQGGGKRGRPKAEARGVGRHRIARWPQRELAVHRAQKGLIAVKNRVSTPFIEVSVRGSSPSARASTVAPGCLSQGPPETAQALGQNQARWLNGSFPRDNTGDGLLKYRQQVGGIIHEHWRTAAASRPLPA